MTEDVVFQSCKRTFRSRSARLTQRDTGEVGQQSEVGNLHASQHRQTTQKSPISSVVPDFVSHFSERSMRLWTISPTQNPRRNPKQGLPNVGSLACAACHKQIYNNYAKTGMGRSMSLVMPEILKAQPTSGSIEDKNTGFHFDVYARDGQLFQSEYKIDSNGKEIFRDTRAVEWIIGSERTVLAVLSGSGDFVFQAPLSFYSKTNRWELSPGYEFATTDSAALFSPDVFFATVDVRTSVAASNGHFAGPPFTELAIGCENCHGPGSSPTFVFAGSKVKTAKF